MADNGGGVGVGHAELPVCAARPRQTFLGVRTFIGHGLKMLRHEAVKADIGADQAGIHVDDIACHHPLALAFLHDTGETVAKQRLAPALAGCGSTRHDRAAGRSGQTRQTSGSPD